MDFSVLHISDLHRQKDAHVSNEALIDSLIADRDRYTHDESIRAPDVIVVSGDIVYGINPASCPDPDTDLKSQYEEAHDLLVRLAEQFVDGDRHRVIIVPGNHDIDATCVHRSLKKLTSQPNAAIVQSLGHPASRFRWSWKELCFYEIADLDEYHKRFRAFQNFYFSFYGGLRTYSDDPGQQYDLFDIPGRPVTFLALNSCHNTDLLNRAAAINPKCVSKASEHLRSLSRIDNRVIAVWHHNTEGGPNDSNYLDAEHLQYLIDRGVTLGLHGHQHRPASLNVTFRYGKERVMPVIAAGTLCGDPHRRHGRSYNIIEVDLATGKGRLSVREVGNNIFEVPVWTARALPAAQKANYSFTVPEPLKRSRTPATSDLAAAQDAMEHARFEVAEKLLTPHAASNPLARRFLLDCLVQTRQHEKITSTFSSPKGPHEVIHVMDALWRTKKIGALASLLADSAVLDCKDQAVIELSESYRRRLRSRP